MDSVSRRLGQLLRQARRKQGLHQQDVGDVLGLSASAVSRLESGDRVFSLDYLTPWAEALGLRAEVVLWEASGGIDPGVSVLGAVELDDESETIIREVAAALPSLDGPARAALVHIVKLWRSEREAASKEG